jgi:hypothetical protein
VAATDPATDPAPTDDDTDTTPGNEIAASGTHDEEGHRS